MAARTWSSSPADTPPLVSSRSCVAAASRSAAGDRRRMVGQDAEVGGHDRQAASSAISVKRLLSKVCAGPSGAPGAASSSPVENTPTRTRGRTGRAREAERGGQPDLRRAQPRAGGQRHRRRPARPRRPGGRWRRASGRAARSTRRRLRARVLLHQHRVGAGGHGRAGEDARRLARRQRPCPGACPAATRPARRAGAAAPGRRGGRRSRPRRRCRTAARAAARWRAPPARRPSAAASAGPAPPRRTAATRSGISACAASTRQQFAAEGEAVVGELRHG